MLGQRYGATDLLFKAKVGGKWCGVEADGETHFERPWRGSSQLRRVRQDREKDEEYLSRAQPVVRTSGAQHGEGQNSCNLHPLLHVCCAACFCSALWHKSVTDSCFEVRTKCLGKRALPLLSSSAAGTWEEAGWGLLSFAHQHGECSSATYQPWFLALFSVAWAIQRQVLGGFMGWGCNSR